MSGFAPRDNASWEKRIKQRFYWLAALVLVPALLPLAVAAQDLRALARSNLESRGFGADGLSIISNILDHEGVPPRRTPPIVDQVLRDPLAGLDAAAIFAASVRTDLQQLPSLGVGSATDFNAVVDRYIAGLAEAQAELMAAVAPFDEDALLAGMAEGMAVALLGPIHRAVELERLGVARALFITATSIFVRDLRSPGLAFPLPQRFESAIGSVVIGGRTNDRHAPGAALIIDPGGDDEYERAPAKGGAISVVVDLGGNDRYTGNDSAVHALSAIFDLAGDDVYAADGIASAVAGVSVVLDAEGNDQYASGVLGQAAAHFGWAALVDLAGDDRYRLKAFGQAYAGVGGVALLWDRGGDDVYVAAGLPDPFDRGGGISFAQGASSGWRGELGGGIGILRDDAGDDRYESQMFSQGAGYYYAFGVLWDRAGKDEYSAVRYSQGNGTHQAAGLLDDEAGDDSYSLTVGVGQGMGLDLAVGALVDRAGSDTYRTVLLSQGTATANGFGILADLEDDNSWSMSADPRSWGHSQWLRGLPSVGVLLHDAARSRFTRSGLNVPAEYRGKHEIEPGPDCKAAEQAARNVIADPARHLGDPALPCALGIATPEEARGIWSAFDVAMGLPNAPFLQPIAFALRQHPGPGPLMAKLSAILKTHPRCAARALWAGTWASADEARAALDSTCWRLQAAALERLQALGVTPPASESIPAFLRTN
jgi:hypothetical protein